MGHSAHRPSRPAQSRHPPSRPSEKRAPRRPSGTELCSSPSAPRTSWSALRAGRGQNAACRQTSGAALTTGANQQRASAAVPGALRHRLPLSSLLLERFLPPPSGARGPSPRKARSPRLVPQPPSPLAPSALLIGRTRRSPAGQSAGRVGGDGRGRGAGPSDRGCLPLAAGSTFRRRRRPAPQLSWPELPRRRG